MGILTHQHHIERRPIGDDLPTLAVKNVATGGGNLTNTNPVGIGPVLVLLSMVDLQRPESENDQGKKINTTTMAPLTLRRRLSREAISHSVISSASFEKSSLNIILGSRGDQSSRPPFKRPRLWLSLLQEFPEGIEQDETWNRSHQENAGLGKQFSPGPFRQQFRLCEEVQYISNQLNNEITEPTMRNLICRSRRGLLVVMASS